MCGVVVEVEVVVVIVALPFVAFVARGVSWLVDMVYLYLERTSWSN